jgi:subtilase-type serine protease
MNHRHFLGASLLVGVSLCGGVSLANSLPSDFETPEYFANWGLGAINASTAYSRGFTGAGVMVGVVDTSIQLTHPEFFGRAATFQFDDVDDHYHGTHVGGIIGAARDGVGMHGVAPGALLSSIRIFNNIGTGGYISDAQVAAGYDAAIAAGIRVFNNSWGRNFDISWVVPADLPIIESWVQVRAYRRAADSDAVLVWSTGNNGRANPTIYGGLPYIFPELQPNWITVASVDQSLALSSFSNACGVAAMWCIAAPGRNIISTVPIDSYGSLSGTSMAAPHVTGAVAIAKQMFPNASAGQLASVVLQTATDIGGAGVDSVFGWGLLNLGNLTSTLDAETANLFSAAGWSKLEALNHVHATIQQRMNINNKDTALGASGLTAYAEQSVYGFPVYGAEASNSRWQQDNIWIAAVGGKSTLESGPRSNGYDSDTAGIVVGVDGVLGDSWRLGFAGGLTTTDLDANAGRNRGDINGYHFLAYAARNAEFGFAQASAQLAYFDQTLERRNVSGSVGTSANVVGLSSTSSIAAEVDVKAGRNFEFNGSLIAPYLAGVARWQDTDGFIENGAGIFSLSASSASIAQFEVGPGLKVDFASYDTGTHKIDFGADVSYAYLAGDRTHTNNANLLGTQINAETVDVGEHVAKIGSQIRFTNIENTMSATLAYRGRLQENANSHSLTAELKLMF